jgi:hypothetical protein
MRQTEEPDPIPKGLRSLDVDPIPVDQVNVRDHGAVQGMRALGIYRKNRLIVLLNAMTGEALINKDPRATIDLYRGLIAEAKRHGLPDAEAGDTQRHFLGAFFQHSVSAGVHGSDLALFNALYDFVDPELFSKTVGDQTWAYGVRPNSPILQLFLSPFDDAEKELTVQAFSECPEAPYRLPIHLDRANELLLRDTSSRPVSWLIFRERFGQDLQDRIIDAAKFIALNHDRPTLAEGLPHD